MPSPHKKQVITWNEIKGESIFDGLLRAKLITREQKEMLDPKKKKKGLFGLFNK